LKSVECLIAKGLAEEGPSRRPTIAETGYRLTEKGWLANEWRTGNRMEVEPPRPRLAELRPRLQTLKPRVAELQPRIKAID
jgi:hypothetical protein